MDRLLSTVDGASFARPRWRLRTIGAIGFTARFSDLREHRNDIATAQGATLRPWQHRDRDSKL
jgi:hypothetical protein